MLKAIKLKFPFVSRGSLQYHRHVQIIDFWHSALGEQRWGHRQHISDIMPSVLQINNVKRIFLIANHSRLGFIVQ